MISSVLPAYENLIVLEHFAAFKRAGANAIVSYYADRIDKIIR